MSERDGEDDGLPVVKLPRGRGFKLSGPELIRIAITAALLVAVILLIRPCSDAVSHFVMGFDNSKGSGQRVPKPGKVDVPPDQTPTIGSNYEQLRPGMSDAEIKAAIERAKAKAAAGSGTPVAPVTPSAP